MPNQTERERDPVPRPFVALARENAETIMLTLAYWLSTFTIRSHAAIKGGSTDFQVCCCFSLLGLIASLAFALLYGPDALLALADAG
jgi:hypothetical protein